MADAARINVESGAQIIDITGGVPGEESESCWQVQPLQYPDSVKSILSGS